MQNLTPVQYWLDETERNAYNAAFYELGLRWHWDRQTYCDLMGTAQEPEKRIGHYLEANHPHLLRAYDAAFLADAIEQKKEAYKRREGEGSAPLSKRHFNWAECRGCLLYTSPSPRD